MQGKYSPQKMCYPKKLNQKLRLFGNCGFIPLLGSQGHESLECFHPLGDVEVCFFSQFHCSICMFPHSFSFLPDFVGPNTTNGAQPNFRSIIKLELAPFPQI